MQEVKSDLSGYLLDNWDELSKLSPKELAKKIDVYNINRNLERQISFDLDTILLRKLFNDNYTYVYEKIKVFMKNNGFKHIEGSVYVSVEPITSPEIEFILNDLKSKMPYLDKCIKEIHIASVIGKHSHSDLFHYDGTLNGLQQEENQKINNVKRRGR